MRSHRHAQWWLSFRLCTLWLVPRRVLIIVLVFLLVVFRLVKILLRVIVILVVVLVLVMMVVVVLPAKSGVAGSSCVRSN